MSESFFSTQKVKYLLTNLRSRFSPIAVVRVVNVNLQVFLLLAALLQIKLQQGTEISWGRRALTGIWPFIKLTIATIVSLVANLFEFFMFYIPSNR